MSTLKKVVIWAVLIVVAVLVVKYIAYPKIAAMLHGTGTGTPVATGTGITKEELAARDEALLKKIKDAMPTVSTTPPTPGLTKEDMEKRDAALLAKINEIVATKTPPAPLPPTVTPPVVPVTPTAPGAGGGIVRLTPHTEADIAAGKTPEVWDLKVRADKKLVVLYVPSAGAAPVWREVEPGTIVKSKATTGDRPVRFTSGAPSYNYVMNDK